MANSELLRDPADADLYGDMRQKVASQKLQKEQQLTDLLKSALGKSREVSPTQAFAASALALLPVLVGKHFAGSQGAAMGAEIGGAAGGGYLGQLGKRRDEEAKLDLTLADRAEGELDLLSKQEGRIDQADMLARRQMANNQDLYGANGAREQFEVRKESRQQAARPATSTAVADPLAEAWLTKKMRGEATTQEEDAAAAKDRSLVSTGATAAKAFAPPTPKEKKTAFENLNPATAQQVFKSGVIADMTMELASDIEQGGSKNILEIMTERGASALDVQQFQQRILSQLRMRTLEFNLKRWNLLKHYRHLSKQNYQEDHKK